MKKSKLPKWSKLPNKKEEAVSDCRRIFNRHSKLFKDLEKAFKKLNWDKIKV